METQLGSETYARLARSVQVRFIRPGEAEMEFICIGRGGSRTVLLGPDGIVYKVQREPFFTQNVTELELFRLASIRGYSWAPDFWHYKEPDVIAMPQYEVLPGLTAHLEITRPELIKEIEFYTFDYGDHNLGVRPNGSIVLLDGGRSVDRNDVWQSPGALVS